MKIWQFLKWLKADAIITIEPKSRKNYFVRKMRKGDFANYYQADSISCMEIDNIEFNDNDDYGIIIAVKEEIIYENKSNRAN